MVSGKDWNTKAGIRLFYISNTSFYSSWRL